MGSEETEGAKKRQRLLKLGSGVTIDILKALPLTLGDALTIKKQHGVDVARLRDENITIEDTYAVISFVVRKVKPDASDEDIQALGMIEMQTAFLEAMASSADVDPT